MVKIAKLIALILILVSANTKGQAVKIMYGDNLYMDYFYYCSISKGFTLKAHLNSGHYEVYIKTDSITYKYIDAYYKDSKKDSSWTYYYPSGKVSLKETYISGVENGKTIGYFENGKIQSDGYNINGTMNGHRVWYNEDGTKRSVITFTDGFKQGIEINYYPNGQIESLENFKRGVFDGVCLYFYQNGQPEKEFYYTKDKPSGLWKYYNENGELTASHQY